MSAAKHAPGPIVWDDDRGCHVMLCGDARISVDALPALLAAAELAAEKLAAMGLTGSVEAIRIRAAVTKATGAAS